MGPRLTSAVRAFGDCSPKQAGAGARPGLFRAGRFYSFDGDACEKVGRKSGKTVYDGYSAFKITSLTVTYEDQPPPPPPPVPVPAAGGLLLAGLGGLAALRRRKR